MDERCIYTRSGIFKSKHPKMPTRAELSNEVISEFDNSPIAYGARNVGTIYAAVNYMFWGAEIHISAI